MIPALACACTYSRNPKMSSKPTNFSTTESIQVVWAALHAYRDEVIPADFPTDIEQGNDEQWDDICTAMAWITEALPSDRGPIPQQTALDLN